MTTPSNFWSRRKQAVLVEQQEVVRTEEAEALAVEQKQQEEKSDEVLLEELNLPDPDTLKQGDDFSVFMSKAVPDRLRRRALRTLWGSNPILANIDGLVDYGEDFTDAGMIIANMQTTYQVGKGMLSHVQEMERQEEARQAEAAEDTVADTPADAAEEAVSTSETDETVEESVLADEDNASIEIAALPVPQLEVLPETLPEPEDFMTEIPRRRMRFSYNTLNVEATQ